MHLINHLKPQPINYLKLHNKCHLSDHLKQRNSTGKLSKRYFISTSIILYLIYSSALHYPNNQPYPDSPPSFQEAVINDSRPQPPFNPSYNVKY